MSEQPYVIVVNDRGGHGSGYVSGGNPIQDADALAGALLAALGQVGIGTRRRIINAIKPQLTIKTPRNHE